MAYSLYMIFPCDSSASLSSQSLLSLRFTNMVSFLSLDVPGFPFTWAFAPPLAQNSSFLVLSSFRSWSRCRLSRQMSPECSFQRSSTNPHHSLSHLPVLWSLCHLSISQIVVFTYVYFLPLSLSYFQLVVSSRKVMLILPIFFTAGGPPPLLVDQ